MIIGISYVGSEYEKKARYIAGTRNFKFSNKIDNSIKYWLVVASNGISLVDTSGRLGPLRVDFLSGSSLYQIHRRKKQRDYLAQAIGKHPSGTLIFDATAGWASDSVPLLARGFKIQLAEQDLVVATLLEDAVMRAYQDGNYGEFFRNNLLLEIGDARQILENIQTKPEVIYLDPMYPKEQKARLPLKAMQYLREIVGRSGSAQDMLTAALRNVRKRVVVKRSINADFLEAMKPAQQVIGKTTRYDVYWSYKNTPNYW